MRRSQDPVERSVAMSRFLQLPRRQAVLLALAGLVLFLVPGLSPAAAGAPVIGSANVATADPAVPRPASSPCVVQLFSNLTFANFSPKPFTYTPPAGCPAPWAKVVLEADFDVTAGRQFDRTAQIAI